MQVVEHTIKTMEMSDTVATRKYPFTQTTLDQVKELRKLREDEYYENTGEVILIPAPIIIAEAVDRLYKQEL